MLQDLTTSRKRSSAFSLIEVVVALGVFAITIVGVLGLLSPTTQAVSDTLDGGVASRLAETVNAEVERLGFTAVTGSQLVLSSAVSALPTNASKLLFATRGGDRICSQGAADTAPNYIAPAERYFEVLLIRNESLSPAGTDNTAGFVAFSVQVSWPAFVDDGTGAAVAVARSQRSVFSFNAAVRR